MPSQPSKCNLRSPRCSVTTLQCLFRILHEVQGHLESAKKESKSVKLEALIPRLREKLPGGVDWSYLIHANSVLLECRRVLSNAYVFAFFMFDAANFKQV
jgi:Ariadne domain